MTHTCKHCGSEFQSRRSGSKFCGRECYGKHRSESSREIVTCEECGDDFEALKSRERRYCSTSCMGDARDTGTEKECPVCKEMFSVVPAREDKRTCCSNSCYEKLQQCKGNTSKQCKYCGEMFEVYKSKAEKRTYCSQSCFKSDSETKVEVFCDWCETKISRIPSRVNRGEHNFCDEKCRRNWLGDFLSDRRQGENNPNWDGGNAPYYYGLNWQEKRQKVLRRDNYECQKCGLPNNEAEKSLHVHHIVKFQKFENHEEANQLNNLISLCSSCHRQVEGNSELGKSLLSDN